MSKHPKKKSPAAKAQPLASPRNWHTHVHFPIAAIVIGAWALIGIFTGIFVFMYAGSMNPPQASQVSTARDFVTFEVQSVRYDAKGIDPFTAPNDQQFVILQVEIENYASSVFNLAPVVQTSITDESGIRYDMSPAVLDAPLAAGPVKPHSSTKGTLSYLVPKLAKHLTFNFDATAPQPVHVTYTIK